MLSFILVRFEHLIQVILPCWKINDVGILTGEILKSSLFCDNFKQVERQCTWVGHES